jgi:hypothetical protein
MNLAPESIATEQPAREQMTEAAAPTETTDQTHVA